MGHLCLIVPRNFVISSNHSETNKGTDHETTTATIDQDFEWVTNAVLFTTDEGFVRMKVEEN